MKDKIVIYREPNGLIHPISIAYGHFFIGVDKVAIFSLDEQIKTAIQEVKKAKSSFGTLPKNGKFHIVAANKLHSFPIEIGHSGTVAHGGKGIIRRGSILSINRLGVNDWVSCQRLQKQISIA